MELAVTAHVSSSPLYAQTPHADDPVESFTVAHAAYDRLRALYDQSVAHLRERFSAFARGEVIGGRVRACYPFVQITTDSDPRIDSRLAYGFVPGPGVYRTTVTRPDLFEPYFREQLRLLLVNHGTTLQVGVSKTPIPIQFAFAEGMHVEGDLSPERLYQLRDHFDLPDLAYMDDSIVNGTWQPHQGEARPLALFTAPRVDYSLHRLKHYTATAPDHFQNYVLFTNYQFYIDEFVRKGHEIMSVSPDAEVNAYRSQYEAFIEPGDHIVWNQAVHPGRAPEGTRVTRLPQMPAYHLKRKDGNGVTIVNIGVGPSNAKTISDHIAVLRPHVWLMLGHCAGLRDTQRLGDYVLAHGYVREDKVLDADLPLWVPVPALAEVQVALERAVEQVTGLSGWDLKRVMRTGTVATIDNRNWELRDQREPVQRFSQSRAIGLDMESATVAANGFRFRVPYGTLLCVSDKPLHGEIKLPGMANTFYRQRVDQHLAIGLLAMEIMRDYGLARLHSRKLRSFAEAAFQ
jgi:AMP nucleosidase